MRCLQIVFLLTRRFIKPHVVFLGILLFSGCAKTHTVPVETEAHENSELANGLPQDLSKLNGYLYAGYKAAGTNGFTYAFFAVFSDPPKPLLSTWNHHTDLIIPVVNGNVSVGDLNVNGFVMQPVVVGTSVFYSNILNRSTPLFASTWETQGNKSFLPFSLNIGRPFPLTKTSPVFPNLSKSTDYILDLKTYGTGYDSVMAVLTDNYGATIRKTADSSVHSLVISKTETANFNSGNTGAISLFMYNYAHQTINSKVYLIEQAGKAFGSVYITP